MKLYTINATPVQGVFTEKQNKENLESYPQVVASVLREHGFDGFTIYPVQGYWKGEAETSFKIELALDKNFSEVYNVATELRDMYVQDSVMVTDNNNNVIFV